VTYNREIPRSKRLFLAFNFHATPFPPLRRGISVTDGQRITCSVFVTGVTTIASLYLRSLSNKPPIFKALNQIPPPPRLCTVE